ncbi:hypothetical protein F4782DRAFT_550680 [Xylaria castorea]|nr:hypothetical protein F4782DRAFT_550680 [Xylaria castorea]
MTSAGPGRRASRASNVTQETLDAMEVYNDELEADVDKWIGEADYIPKDGNYDWRPFCRALIENHRSAKGIFPDPPSPPPSNKNNRKRPRGARDVLKGIQPQDEPLGLAPEPGKDWEHVRYIPAWMDPEYTDDKLETPAGRQMHNTVRDAVYNLRPALRLGDEIRRPTDYALRFGIAADRLDGRSRMSPTWSRTRNPLESDFYKQIDQLSEENRKLALELSLERWREMGKTPTPGLEILPDVMEKLLEQHGLMANVGLATKIEQDVWMGRNFDEMVDHIRTTNPDALKAHQGFLEMLQDDQDYQRVLLVGLTTDELVQNNIHTMSNDVAVDLDNPIHFLFERSRWDNGWWRGVRKRSPRNVYNINGTREEYNAVTNDALWDALQPALRLVSMVLAKNPPHLEAIINMNTRQPILTAKGGKEDQFPPTLTRYVLEKDIDMSKTYTAIRQLSEVHNYDWKANVFRVLERTLVLDIESAYTLASPSTIQDYIPDDAHRQFCFGSCGTFRKYGPAPGVVPPGEVMIKLRIAADIMWPLLVPQYSKSEKMACSFIIASTLLHEFSHAVNQAQELLTNKKWQPPGQDPEIGQLLKSLDGVVWDVHFGEHQEPFYYDEGGEELGHNFEYSLWGRSVNLTGDTEGLSRFHQTLMFVLGEETHPIDEESKREDVVQPMMRYMRPVPIDYMAKLFSKRFWKEEFEAYGFGAMRMMSDSYLQKNLMYTPAIPSPEMDEALYGKKQAKFLKAVPTILMKSRHFVLGAYLSALRMEIAYRAQYEKWWVTEVQNWEEDLLHPLQGSIDLLDDEFHKTRDLNTWHLASIPDRVSYYGRYRSTKNPGDPDIMAYPDWQEDVAEQWKEMLRYGGWLMQRLLVVHNHMRNDIGNLQRMTFYFLAVKPQNTRILFRGPDDEHTLSGILFERLEKYRSEARRITGMLNYFGNLAQLRDTKDKWEQWEARFKSNGEQYNTLMQMLQEGSQIDSEPFDISWKVRFNRLPTGNWKQVSEIHKKMAHREYSRADPAIRKTIDDFLRDYTALNLIDTSEVKTTVGKIGRALKSMKDLAQRTTGQGRTSIFDFFPSPQHTTGPPPPLPPTAQPPPQPSQSLPAPAPTSGYIFGVPGKGGKLRTSKGNSPPRRITGVQKPKSSAKKSAAYQSYVTNLLTKPDPRLASGAAAELFKSGLPQPILDLLPPQTRPLGKSRRTPIKPFPNPYAGRNVMTSLETAFQEQTELVEKNRQALHRAKGVYVAPSLWRENTWGWGGEDEDVDVEMSDVSDVEASDSN